MCRWIELFFCLFDAIFERLLFVLDGFFYLMAEILQFVMTGQRLFGIAEAMPEQDGGKRAECDACQDECAPAIVKELRVAHGAGELGGALVAASGVLFRAFCKDGAQRTVVVGAQKFADGDAECV